MSERHPLLGGRLIQILASVAHLGQLSYNRTGLALPPALVEGVVLATRKGSMKSMVGALIVVVCVGCGRPAAEPPPGCEPVGPTPDRLYYSVSMPGWDREELARDIDAIQAAIHVSQGAGAPPSKEYEAAQRAFATERWAEAGDGFRTVAKRNGADDRATRQTAQYFFGAVLYRMRFTTEAAAIFRQIKADPSHPKRASAEQMLTEKWCER